MWCWPLSNVQSSSSSFLSSEAFLAFVKNDEYLTSEENEHELDARVADKSLLVVVIVRVLETPSHLSEREEDLARASSRLDGKKRRRRRRAWGGRGRDER